MKGFLQIIALVLLAGTPVSAASTKLVSSWKNPLAGPIDVSSMKVAAFVMSSDQTMRWGPEETLATELRKRGLDCIAGYTVLPGELAKDKQKAKEFLSRAGITGAVVMRVVVQERTRPPQASVYSSSYYPSFWDSWDYGWTTIYTFGADEEKKDREVSIEILFYSIEEDKLLWAGQSETTNPKDVRKFAKELVDAAGKAMRKDGLVKK